jgi:hypothetical protein
VPRVTVRDRRTLEVRQVFPLPAAGQTARYDVEMYFFMPRSFGVTPASYNKERFYRDGQALLRLTSTGAPLAELSDLSNTRNPAHILRNQLADLTGPDAPDSETLEALAQMFGAEVADGVEREAADLRKEVEREGSPPAEAEARLERFCAEALGALGTMRRLRAKTLAYRAVAPRRLLDSLAFAEEYACAVIDEEMSELAQVIDDAPALFDGRGTAVRMRLRIARTLQDVNERRRDQGFAVPWGKSPEFFSYRIGLLKKEVQRALYLDTRNAARDPLIVNSAAMVAAGLAATWATLAQLPLWTGGWGTSQGVYFLLIAVGAYILKDRIKEWVRMGLARRLLKWDHDKKIVGDALSRVGLGRFSGRARERVEWRGEDNDIPEQVWKLRRKHRTVRGVEPELERVLHYTRSVEIAQDPAEPVPVGMGVKELFRFSLNDVLRRLDDPLDQVSFYDTEAGGFRTQELPKVYHLNLVVVATEGIAGEQHLTRWRVVVNRKGILRVDEVATGRGRREVQPGNARLSKAA